MNASGSSSHLYGYMMTGSQSMGYGAWGNLHESQSETYQCVRFELGVGLFPYNDSTSSSSTKDNKTGNLKYINLFDLPEHFAIDLSEIVLPWSPGSLESYEGRRFNLKFDETLQTYVGIVSHFKRNDVC